jgi:hypothetical protein
MYEDDGVTSARECCHQLSIDRRNNKNSAQTIVIALKRSYLMSNKGFNGKAGLEARFL